MKNIEIMTSFGFSVIKEKLDLIKNYEEEYDQIYKDSEQAFYEEDEEWMDQLEKEHNRLTEQLYLEFDKEIEQAGGCEIPSLFWKD